MIFNKLPKSPHFAALIFYSLLTLLIAWQPLTNLALGTPGDFPIDRNQNLWNFWWFKQSLFNWDNPYNTNLLFYPYGTKLYLHTFSPYNLIIGLPLQLIFGLIPTYSFIELLTFPLGAYTAYLLAHYLVKNQWGALLAGLVWSFGPYHFVELRQDQLNLLSLQWLPLFILFLFKLEQAQTRRDLTINALAASLVYLLTLMVDYYYAIYLLMFAGLYWLWEIVNLLWQKRRAAFQPISVLTLKFGVVFGLGMLPYSPILLATIRETTSPAYTPLDNTSIEQVHSADLLQLFLPPTHHPLWGSQASFWPSETLLNNWGAVLGYVALGLSIYALLTIKGLWFWAYNALFWIIISFGPTLRINGSQTDIAMPYRLLIKLPFIGIGRFPERYILMAQLSLAILAAYGLARLLAKIKSTRLQVACALLIMSLFVFESWPGFLPIPKPIVQPAFATALNLASIAKDKAILELPVTKHSNPDSPRMLYQIYHGRPITGGYISRKLIDPHRVANDYILYDWLELRTVQNDIIRAKTPQEQLGLLSYANMGFVVVYPADFANDAGRKQAEQLIKATFEQTKPYFQDALATVYAVPPTKLERPTMVLGQGWATLEQLANDAGMQRWIDQEAIEARVNIAVGEDTLLAKSYSLEFKLVSPDKPRRVQIFLNGQVVKDFKVEGISELKLENLTLQRGDNILTLRPDPADGYFVPTGDQRRLRIGVLSIKLS